jgi:hypothetical protein
MLLRVPIYNNPEIDLFVVRFAHCGRSSADIALIHSYRRVGRRR